MNLSVIVNIHVKDNLKSTFNEGYWVLLSKKYLFFLSHVYELFAVYKHSYKSFNYKNMRKLFFAVSVGAMLSLSLNSCSKKPMPEPAIKQTIDVQLSANQTYTFLLPMNIRDDAYEFTTQALHHELSILDVNASGQRIYQYTPAKDYFGFDQVVVSNDWEREEHELEGNHQGPPQGNCHEENEPEEHYIITFNFEIGRNAQSISSAK